jgi:hypothetical protein
MREIRTSGSTSERWKRSMVQLVRHRQTKEPVTDRLHLNHRATSRLYSGPWNAIGLTAGPNGGPKGGRGQRGRISLPIAASKGVQKEMLLL